MVKMNNFRGDLIDTSAKKEALEYVAALPPSKVLHFLISRMRRISQYFRDIRRTALRVALAHAPFIMKHSSP